MGLTNNLLEQNRKNFLLAALKVNVNLQRLHEFAGTVKLSATSGTRHY